MQYMQPPKRISDIATVLASFAREPPKTTPTPHSPRYKKASPHKLPLLTCQHI